jgi:hypothetical protein
MAAERPPDPAQAARSRRVASPLGALGRLRRLRGRRASPATRGPGTADLPAQRATAGAPAHGRIIIKRDKTGLGPSHQKGFRNGVNGCRSTTLTKTTRSVVASTRCTRMMVVARHLRIWETEIPWAFTRIVEPRCLLQKPSTMSWTAANTVAPSATRADHRNKTLAVNSLASGTN